MRRSGHKSDPRMPESGKVLNGLANAVLIVDANIAYTRHVRPNINEHQRHLAEAQVLDQRLFHSERQNGHTVDPALDHPPDGQLHPLGIVDRGSQKYFVIMLDGNILEGLDDLREKRVGDFGNDETENPALAGDERAGLGVWIVAEFFDHFPDTLGKLRIN